MNECSYDYIIVGHGLAGSVLSYLLLKEGKKIIVIDKFNENSSSQVAAGLINPITGRRVVKTWMADTLIPCAEIFYRDLERELSADFYFRKDVLEVVNTVKEQNDWTNRTADPELKKYLSQDIPENNYRDKISDFKKIFRITSSAWLDIPKLIFELSKHNNIQNDFFEIPELIIEKERVIYRNLSARRIIFCEGAGVVHNAHWNRLPLLPAKGEIVTIECRNLPEDFIILRGIFLLPVGDHKFRAGSTYEWKFTDEKPSEKGKEKLLTALHELLKLPFTVIDHKAGVRPTVKDRRPLLGAHTEYKNIFIFNGLGTKGALLTPYFALHFIDFLERSNDLLEEVDVKRFLH